MWYESGKTMVTRERSRPVWRTSASGAASLERIAGSGYAMGAPAGAVLAGQAAERDETRPARPAQRLDRHDEAGQA